MDKVQSICRGKYIQILRMKNQRKPTDKASGCWWYPNKESQIIGLVLRRSEKKGKKTLLECD